MPVIEKIQKADVVIDNSGSFDDLKKEFAHNTMPRLLKLFGVQYQK